MALAGALDARKAADMQVRVAALERRVASVPFTAHDARIVAALPAGPLAELDMRPDDFVRLVANVYDLTGPA